ncbi:universal stress protein, partial [Streptomyces sp. SID11233]|nr:universal stress protein [Streptomyces sp. SID11233]
RGGYTGMRLGSVARGALRRAHCPVIVVPTP